MSEPGIQDRTIGELTRLEALLQPGDTERHAVVARLGTLLALRYAGAGGGAAEDRKRVLRYMREVRAAEPKAPDWERRCAAAGLLVVLFPSPELGGRDGRLPDHAAFMDWCLKDGASLDVAELPELFTDVQALPMPPELRQVIDQAVPALALLKEMLRPGGVAKVTGEQVSSVLPDDFPWADQVRMVNWVRARVRDQPRTSDEEPRAEQSEAARAESERRKRARILSSMEAVTPGFISPDALRRMNEELERDPAHSRARPDDRALEALPRVLQEALAAVRNSDPDQLDVALDHMADALGLLPQGHELAGVMEVLRSVLVGGGDANGGNLQDAELGHQLLESLRQRFTASETSPPWHLTVLVRLLSAQSRLERAQHAEDLAELDGVIDELLSLRDIASRDDDLSVNVLMALAEAYQARGAVRGDGSDRLRMFECLEKIEQLEDFSPALKEPIGHLVSLIRIQRGMDENDPELIREGLSVLQPTTVLRSEAESRSARGLLALYHQTKDPSALDQAIAGFERISERIRQGEEATLAGSVLWNLAEAYACRSDRTEDPADLDAAIATALDSLHSVASDVLLQSGAEHGLLAARKGGERGVLVARWAAACGHLEEAVEALEWSRALVLQAASASAGVPELLRARGQRELADAWSGMSSSPPGEPGRQLPSSLRRRALEALGYRRHDDRRQLFSIPTIEELCDATAAADNDALVYLVPGDAENPGVAVFLVPGIGSKAFLVPALSGEGSGPLAAYLEAAAARSRYKTEAAETVWEDALGQLCDWAWSAMMGHVREMAVLLRADGRDGYDGEGEPDASPPRVVLVPCGNLGVVPWHAARVRDGDRYRYACEDMVVSYAASGSQLLLTVGREQRAIDSAPVLVADPRLSLTHAEREISALQSGFYPRARLFGEFYQPPVPPEAPGTPAELLALLTAANEPPLSLLHVASHGSAGPSPTVSALSLAFPGDSESWPAGLGGPGALPDAGMLTVTRLLDRPAEDTARRDSGPLVVLSACETDLSTRDHDEALTLTTAFVARGARNVVGSRWTTADGASALMMAVFHHFAAVDGLDPAAALRAAQLWMLNPARQLPCRVKGIAARDAEAPDLERPMLWAAFIHQGHPGLSHGDTSTGGVE
ncbi:CHAT domain-containing protein [Streptomyces sp. NBC_01431]|uniref:CHAT domain-containing protein n=1 Tax=Streptomyces sp. NBC_01431 TaxID=2903863 RepID=UPI002E32C304|nr:CHAT domain-containing protein [Streptomyces sp. NBC_01431]